MVRLAAAFSLHDSFPFSTACRCLTQPSRMRAQMYEADRETEVGAPLEVAATADGGQLVANVAVAPAAQRTFAVLAASGGVQSGLSAVSEVVVAGALLQPVLGWVWVGASGWVRLQAGGRWVARQNWRSRQACNHPPCALPLARLQASPAPPPF